MFRPSPKVPNTSIVIHNNSSRIFQREQHHLGFRWQRAEVVKVAFQLFPISVVTPVQLLSKQSRHAAKHDNGDNNQKKRGKKILVLNLLKHNDDGIYIDML